MADISLQNVKKVYENGTMAVKGFNLEIKDGDFVIIVGPSGCGKTTTLRMIAGLEDISDGKILIDGEDVTQKASKDRDIAMVFQNYALYPHMTVFDNISFGLKIRKIPKPRIRKKVLEAAEILGLEELLDRKPGQLSGGQRQRTAMARAMVRNPKAFLMDEPLSNLDAKLRSSMRAELARLHEKLHSTVIYVTHDQTEAMTLGNKIVVMRDGDIMQVGSPLELYWKPGNLFVAQFIGTPQMNAVEARMILMNEKPAVEMGGWTLPVNSRKGAALWRRYRRMTVLVGIRPEHIKVKSCKNGEENENLLKLKISGREILGAETILYTEFQGIPLTVKCETAEESLHSEFVNVEISENLLYFFDVKTGEAVKGE